MSCASVGTNAASRLRNLPAGGMADDRILQWSALQLAHLIHQIEDDIAGPLLRVLDDAVAHDAAVLIAPAREPLLVELGRDDEHAHPIGDWARVVAITVGVTAEA